MGIEENKDLVRRFVAVGDAGDVDAFGQYIIEGIADHQAETFPGIPPGLEGVKQIFAMLKAAFPDIRTEIEDLVAEGDKVVIRSSLTGTHKGDFMGTPATGKQIAVSGIDIVRIHDGKMVEHWGLLDMPLLMQQLGLMPA